GDGVAHDRNDQVGRSHSGRADRDGQPRDPDAAERHEARCARCTCGRDRAHQTSPSASRRRRSPTAKTVPASAATNAPSTKGKRSTAMMTLSKVPCESCAKAALAPMLPKNGTAAKPSTPTMP